MAKLVENSEPFDVITLSERLSKLSELEVAGGHAYLGELAKNTPSVSNIRAYAEIVRERSVLRQLVRVASDIADNAFNTRGRSSNEVLDEA